MSQEPSGRKMLAGLFTNMKQDIPLHEKWNWLRRNLWRRVVLRQSCCGNHGKPGC